MVGLPGLVGVMDEGLQVAGYFFGLGIAMAFAFGMLFGIVGFVKRLLG